MTGDPTRLNTAFHAIFRAILREKPDQPPSSPSAGGKHADGGPNARW